MEIAIVNVNAVSASLEHGLPIPRGMVGGKVTIRYLDPVWDSLTKTAVFRGAVTKDVMNVSNTVEIPWETVEKAGKKLYFGLYGTNGDGSLVIPTIWTELGIVEGAADPTGDASTELTPDVWEQMRAMIGNLSDLDTQNKDTVVDAINETLASGGVDEEEVRTVVMDCLETVGTGADVYILAAGETIDNAPKKADIVLAPEESGGIWADWNANEGEPGYIQNRPFCDTPACILEESELEFVYSEEIGLTIAIVTLQQLPIAVGTYRIRFGDAEYSCVCVFKDGTLFMGNMSMLSGDDTGEPFLIMMNHNDMIFIPLTEVSSAVISVSGMHPAPIARKYLPESVMLDLVALGLPTVKESTTVSIPFENMLLLEQAYKAGTLRVRVNANYTQTLVFMQGYTGTTEEACVTAQIQRINPMNYEIRAFLEDNILFINAESNMIKATIRRIALV